jgi:heme exporter protein A
MRGTARLALDKIACVRGDRLLFEGLSFALGAGGAALVVGPNGSGKSSLLRLVAGLLRPAAGSISRTGELAWLGEQPALDGSQPLYRALSYWADIDRVDKATVPECLGYLGIGHLAEVPVRMLSTGQRRRAGLARVMMSGAVIWLLDEPANGLDAGAIGLLQSAVARHLAAGGIVIAATHQPLEIGDALIVDLGA